MLRTAFITGCSSGFGEATATRFLDAGWNVIARQLRWVIGVDRTERMHMRWETSDAAYNDWTLRHFSPSL